MNNSLRLAAALLSLFLASACALQGTPRHSLGELRNALLAHNAEDALKYVDVESVVDHIIEDTFLSKESGMKTVNRFSPGYGDWELNEQKGLLHQLGASQIGISLSSAFLMHPEKSVSGVIGWVEK